ncbi:hypothetical protein OESDEN_02667 [Oesophagostomum dentatum]|uniref:Uncharacterized protein n=1 Tax=Oesophagostomum dentatum TaxID=61180 RepID=A0A0B1TPN7_OESDE|nr:hypothetical protein OESDEN_02667 [Oesophagostomum dentatum]
MTSNNYSDDKNHVTLYDYLDEKAAGCLETSQAVLIAEVDQGVGECALSSIMLPGNCEGEPASPARLMVKALVLSFRHRASGDVSRQTSPADASVTACKGVHLAAHGSAERSEASSFELRVYCMPETGAAKENVARQEQHGRHGYPYMMMTR